MSARSELKLRVLIVEDSIEEAHLLRAILDRDGRFLITAAQDGDHAARLIGEREFDLVVTDLNLPGLDGYDLIRLIKTGARTIPVLATTGYTAPHYVDHAFRAGADDVLIKPLDPKEVLQKVGQLLGTEAEETPRPPAVLAIGARPGDVEGGCAGTLLACRARGDEVLILPFTGLGGDGATRADAERVAAEKIGARMIVSGASVALAANPTEHQMLLERIVREMKPHTAFIPSLADDDPERREAHRIARVAVAEVATVLGYETPTSTPDFHPTRFVDVSAQLARKLDVLGVYRGQARPDLEESYVLAAARHWGRHLRFGNAEAFEVLRDASGPAS